MWLGNEEHSLESPHELGRILLVDDLALFRRLLPVRLGALGREVESVPNVEEARNYLARRHPELILLDVVMPGVDGFVFCRELKADARTRDIPVIMLTDLKANAHDRSLEAGADDYMPKRIDDAVMRVRVQLHMHLMELRRKANGAPSPESPASILLATSSSVLQAQLPAQFAQDGHSTRVVGNASEIVAAVIPQDRLLVMDMDLGLDEMHEVLAELRMDPATAGLPVLLLCGKEQLEDLTAIEFMVDDVLWKPLNAQVNRHRLRYLLELGRRTLGLT
jgi:two-component system cell cycle response regulator